DLKTAEIQMRKAVAAPGADSRVRQNLALVVGLQGRFEEAEKIAREELTPEQASANIAYLRQMLSQQNAWNALASEDDRATNCHPAQTRRPPPVSSGPAQPSFSEKAALADLDAGGPQNDRKEHG